MERKYYKIYSPGTIGPMTLSNRLVRSATWDPSVLKERQMNKDTIDIYEVLAGGGVGLIITGDFSVIPRHAMSKNGAGTLTCHYDDVRIEGYDLLPQVVHRVAPDCKIVAQISAVIPNVAPSEVSSPFLSSKPRVLSVSEIKFISHCLSACICGIQQDGFDGVQFHAAHGGLLSQFLSPHTNRRQDEYGGSAGNRVRILRQAVNQARKTVGEFPILVKLNGTDYVKGGIDLNNFSELVHEIEAAGIDAIEVSGGMMECLIKSESELGFRPVPRPESHTRIGKPDKQSYFLKYAESLDVSIPIILVGGNRDIERLENILHGGNVDFIAMCRPLINEPHLPQRWLEGRGKSGTYCASCNACIWDMTTSMRSGKTWIPTCVIKEDKNKLYEAQKWLSTWVENHQSPFPKPYCKGKEDTAG